jgi:TM2 domain-containing membrane protein YozV
MGNGRQFGSAAGLVNFEYVFPVDDARTYGCRYHRVILWVGVVGMSAGQGSTGNVLAAICSFFIPGLGQLVQGRFWIALVMFVLAAILWIVWLGWIIHLWSILDAAMFKPKA